MDQRLREVLREVEHVQQNLATDRKRIEELENAKRLDKLPQEVWKKVLDNLSGSDLFPLALSCRYFRQKQKELVERTRQNGKPGLALKTTFLQGNPVKGQLASADYLRFCSKEEVQVPGYTDRYSRDLFCNRIRRLAAFYGHLTLLQELFKPLKTLDPNIAHVAGDSPSSQSPLLLCFGF